jgi:hypothetical protein
MMANAMHWCLLALFLVRTLFCTAASHPAHAKPIDLAEFFHELDAEFSALDSESQALHAALDRKSKSKPSSWQKPAALFRQHVNNILAVARKYQAAADSPKSTSAHAIFMSLESACLRTARTAQLLQVTRKRSAALELERRLDTETVALVRREQKLVAGFPSLKCGEQESACCVSRIVHEDGDTYRACRWVCQKDARKCKSGLCSFPAMPAPQ